MIRVALFLLLAVAALAQDKSLWQPYYVWPREGAQHLDLSRDWELTDREKELANGESIPSDSKWRKVQRPTSVQMALHKAGELPHPYEHLNSDKYKWVDEKVWYYRKTFTAPAAHDGYAYLYFHGIDYFARVWLNGKPLGRHEGMFGGPALEVSKELKPGSPNELLVEVRAGNYGNKAGYKPRDPGRIIKPWVIAGGTGGEMFFPLGMWQGVRLDLVPRTHLDRPFLRTISASDREARLHVSVEILRDAHSLEQEFHPTGNVQMRYYRDWWKLKDQQRPMAVVFELADRASKKVVHRKPMNVSVVPGRNWLESEVTIPDPKLWWPNGMGDAHLYRARLILQDGANEIDRIELDYGIRTLQTERTPGPRMTDRWSDWQFVVNGRKFFVKGMNWMPADILLDLPRERYHWLLSAAKNAGIQMLRVWGGGIIEPEAFYEVANELGILVWQDFPIGNMFTPLYPQPVWEAQVMHTIYRLRNHPSLAVWCGGNEFNPYAEGNAASIGILERSLADFDGTRPFRRTSPDNGSMHDYPDMDPTWYSRKFPYLPYMAETGMHNIPSARTLREVISPAELAKPVERMYDPSFEKNFPELRHHFVEYQPTRVPRMLSRASHVIDITKPGIDELAEATQIGAGEFYQVMSEALQTNYPVTAGLMPWVFKRPWPVVAIQALDGFGHPTAPYYFLKRTYEKRHVAWKAEHLLLAPGESVPFRIAVTNSEPSALAAAVASVEVLDDRLRRLWSAKEKVDVSAGPSVSQATLGTYKLPADYADRHLFVVIELKDSAGSLVSRQVYWPRSMSQLADLAARERFRNKPVEWPSLDKGPWLKPTVAANQTTISAKLIKTVPSVESRMFVDVQVTNTGEKPAFPVQVEFDGARYSSFGSDNYFWLAPGESRVLRYEVLKREEKAPGSVVVTAWNSTPVNLPIP